MNSFDKEKLSLVDYFIKVEKYNVYKVKPRSNNNVYLYKVDNKQFQIIKIVDNFNSDPVRYKIDDEVILSLREYLTKKFQRAKLNVLSIVLIVNNSQQIRNDNGDVTLFVDNNNYQNKVAEFFPSLQQNDSGKEENLKNMSAEQILEDIKDPNSKLTKNLKQLSDKLSMNNLMVTWIFAMLLLAIPIIQIFFGNQLFQTKGLDADSVTLVYGGITRDLLVWSQQWWRLWTYPLFDSNIFLLILNIFILFNISRYNEAVLGRWKLALIIIIGVPLAGLFLSATMPNTIFSGSFVVLAILWGALFSYNFGKEDLASLVSNQRTIIVPIWLIILPLITSNFPLYLVVFSGFFIGSALGFLFEFKIKKINLSILYPIFILTAVLIIGIVLLSIHRYSPPLNAPVVNALIVYWNAGLTSKGTIQDMLLNYYHYPRNEWPPGLRTTGNFFSNLLNLFGNRK
ncbi:hypothetical protein P344_04210 [Spiroplasma mirum ATCC 29335]|uniref:Peptidase S54 rhomboid domain-containing protein n=1 Tax=Spiroplasma mirum ATCC 29335 TaxID=838561 RepID=W0GR72_9MOLU|nr:MULTISPECIES: rhomboid family intramembrane serine protease [Spiroplasma]AHF61119.1 putative transmembrane protein [Spiroplasma mirum ATCC 29335]AHI58168.1 hypothetical protein P344_04210 [Spiroplasma mirum ATCC 29335]AKM53219.1 putative rhomboid-like transmembrane protein [Spiroplasma atrichopogonis]